MERRLNRASGARVAHPRRYGSVTFLNRYPETLSILTSFDLVIVVFFFSHIYFSFLPFISGLTVIEASLDAFGQRLLHFAFADSTHRNITSNINVYTMFCRSTSSSPFPTLPNLLFGMLRFLLSLGDLMELSSTALAASTLPCHNFLKPFLKFSECQRWRRSRESLFGVTLVIFADLQH